MKKPLALCTAALVALGLAVAPALGAAAEDAPPPADVVELTVPQDEPDPERLAICHSGSGVNWTFITPDASGYNGHQHHDADIYGLSEAECLAKNVAEEEPAVDQTPFILIAWPMGSWIDEHTPTWPQGVAAGLAAPFTVDLATRNLDALDATLNALLVPCETSVQYQVDGNFDTAPVRNTIAGGSLYGPNNPAEALWGGGWGEAYKLVKVDGPECPVVNPLVLTAPSLVDRCSSGEIGDYGYDLTLPEDTEFVDYGDEGGDIDGVNYVWVVAQPKNGAVIPAPGPGDSYELTEYGARWAFTYTDERCQTIEFCATEGTLPTATNLDPQGWVIKADRGEFVEGGLHLYSTADSSGWAYKLLNIPFSQVGDLSTAYSGKTDQYTFGVILTLDGPQVDHAFGKQQIHYDEDGRYWTDQEGILGNGAVLKGGYWETYDIQADLINDVTIANIVLYVNAGHGGLVIHEQGHSCGTQPFDYEEPVVEPEFVTPLPPTFDEFCSVDRDAVNVPEDTEAYSYEIDDQRVGGVGTVDVWATANEGYAFAEEAVTGWSHDFTNEACPVKVVDETPIEGELAQSGVDGVTGLIAITVFLLAVGGLFAGIAVYRRRTDRTVD